jgi:hypothetical protein
MLLSTLLDLQPGGSEAEADIVDPIGHVALRPARFSAV